MATIVLASDYPRSSSDLTRTSRHETKEPRISSGSSHRFELPPLPPTIETALGPRTPDILRGGRLSGDEKEVTTNDEWITPPVPHDPPSRTTPTSFAVIETGQTAPENLSPSDGPAPAVPPSAFLPSPRSSGSGAAAQHAPLFPFPAQRSTGIPKNVPGPRMRLLHVKRGFEDAGGGAARWGLRVLHPVV